MGLDRALDISVSGIDAQRRVMELIASNIANINTTRTMLGGPYRRQVAVLKDKPVSFDQLLAAEQNRLYSDSGGVEVSDVVDDRTPFPKVYNPGHPDADSQGYVSLPNVSLATEMTDLVYVSHMYDANITAFNATKKMMQDTLQLQ
ncbi:MAG TPA: flagellar basal body rod protein FlgC [Candidatus Sulfotelmatobacter sp.]|nr:flagellar basal body rod protein FlgC [Candidatus Sulfotelmatobacter sp.]